MIVLGEGSATELCANATKDGYSTVGRRRLLLLYLLDSSFPSRSQGRRGSTGSSSYDYFHRRIELGKLTLRACHYTT